MRYKSILSVSILVLASVGSLLFFLADNASGGTVVWGGHIDTDISWRSEDSPYWVKGTVTIDLNATLIIGDDVLIKFDPDSGFFVEGSLFVNGSESQPVILTSNATIPSSGDWLGIRINKTGRTQISNCIVEYADIGVDISESSNNTIQGSRFEHSLEGLRFWSSKNNSVIDSQMAYNQIGIQADDLSNSSIQNVRTFSNERGLEFDECFNNSIVDLQSMDNVYDGVYLASSYNNTIFGGDLSTNGRFGIFLDKTVGKSQSQNNTISGLNISGNVEGVHIQDSSSNRFFENNITNNINGIFIVQPSEKNVLSRNSILGNLRNAIISSNGNTAEFNYWGTTDADQIGKLVAGGILAQNSLPFRESEVERIVGDVVWAGTKLFKKGVIVDGNLTLDQVEIEFCSESGSNFIQVSGTLSVIGSLFHSTNGNFSIVYLDKSSGYVSDSTFEGQMGIGIHTESGFTILNSTLRNGRAGVLTHKSRNGNVDSLIVIGSMTGMSLSESDNYSVNNSVFVSNLGTGVSLYLTSNTTISHSTISSNGFRGVYVKLSHSNRFFRNNISFNGEFGLFLSNSYDNLLFNNNIISNTFQAYDKDNLSDFDNGYPVGGNFWSDYLGSDSRSGPGQDIPGSDGIGDSPYAIPLSSFDRYPLISPYINAGNTSPLDETPPGRITDLAVSSTGASSVTLTWTAPGDDGYLGIASSYDIRYSLNPITDATWDSAFKIDNEPFPGLPGTKESKTVSDLLEARKYYFAVKTSDEIPNWSDLSNVASGQTKDISPPLIENLTLSPRRQEVYGNVNITARIVDNTEVALAEVNVSGPGSQSLNVTMISLGSDWYCFNGSYDELGAYRLIIWACDGSSNCDHMDDEFEMADLSPPTADAGDDVMVTVGQSILLDAGNSTDNYGIANYTWLVQTDGDAVELHGEVQPYNFSQVGTYNITLIVTDFGGNEDEDWLTVFVEEQSQPTSWPLFWWLILIIAVISIMLIFVFLILRRNKREVDEEVDETNPPNSV